MKSESDILSNTHTAIATQAPQFKRVMVALDLSAMDEQLIRFTAALSRVLGIERVYFVHIMKNFDLPGNLDIEFQKLFAPEYPVDEKVRDKLALEVQEVFGEAPGVDMSVEVIEGNPYEKLIHWTKVKEIDLLVVGHKQNSNGSGITARRVARKAECHVLFAPEQAPREIRRIIAPIDFSENAVRALQASLALRRQAAELQALYVIDMPPGDYYMQPHQDAGFRKMLAESAQAAYRKFLEQYELPEDPIQPVFLENNFVNVAAHIDEYARENAADLIVLGAQGHTALENFLYGSITESLVERCREIPILIIR